MSREITQDFVKEWIKYDPETGIFTWLKKPNRRILIGSVAGSIKKTGRDIGRTIIRVNGIPLGAHRLAWLCVTGEWPVGVIDHVNGNPQDNRFKNLRDVSYMENSQNLREQPTGCESGLLGAGKGRRGKWVARIRINGKPKYLGEYAEPEDAHQAYVLAKRKYHTTCSI